MSPKSCGKDEAVPENSTLPEISMWSWGYCVQTKKTSRSFNEMYGFFCVASVRNQSWWFQEVDVVRNHEGVQLKGHFHVVQVRLGKRNGFHAQTNWRKSKNESAAGMQRQNAGLMGLLTDLRCDTGR